MSSDLSIQPFHANYTGDVISLFTEINSALAPAGKEQAFENYIQISLDEDIGRIEEYYSEKQGGFWIALKDEKLVGMCGLEAVSNTNMELRQMYVAPSHRRQGIAQNLLSHAEVQCAKLGKTVLELSTSEIQEAALQLYPNAGFVLQREEVATEASNKTIGGGINRFYFEKQVEEAQQ
ncbi:MAG: GNAT family N-acetyltransferase [Hyphomicrobiales bacterium]|nr:MAG: GNAT family N-acetyltransferase [Hyphomicrobiales bacterium]